MFSRVRFSNINAMDLAGEDISNRVHLMVMKEKFEGHLRSMNDTVRELRDDDVSLKEALTEPDVGEKIEQSANDWGTSEEAQEKILGIQYEKAAVMDELHQGFQSIDRGEGVAGPEGSRSVIYDHETGHLYADIDGVKETISRGELFTDGEWGLSYSLDTSVPTAIQKRYLVEQTKRTLRKHLDTQILEDLVGKATSSDQPKRIDFLGRQRTAMEGKGLFRKMLAGELEVDFGNRAEAMVRNFLKKLTIDHDLDFEVIDSDVHQDAVEKIDFIIHRTDRNRGVQVQGSTTHDVGIQFTITNKTDILHEKEREIQKARERNQKTHVVDDIVLVTISLRQINLQYERWLKDKKPGGPEKLWERDIQAQIVRGVLKKVMSNEEIEDIVTKLG